MSSWRHDFRHVIVVTLLLWVHIIIIIPCESYHSSQQFSFSRSMGNLHGKNKGGRNPFSVLAVHVEKNIETESTTTSTTVIKDDKESFAPTHPFSPIPKVPILPSIPKSFSKTPSLSELQLEQVTQHEEKKQVMNSKKEQKLSPAALWHQKRRRAIMNKYGEEIRALVDSNSSKSNSDSSGSNGGLKVGLPILMLSNTSLAICSILSSTLSIPQIFILATLFGSILSLWQLQILHDCLHGTLLPQKMKNRSWWQRTLLFAGSMPSAFGYYLYLQYGHLSHHRAVGGGDTDNNIDSSSSSDNNNISLRNLFESSQKDFEDGDILFVSHRMKLKGDIGPNFKLPFKMGKEITASISRFAFSLWSKGNIIKNALLFSWSFLFERMMLVCNDVVVAILGKNLFFPNKPKDFHKECAFYCRWAVLVRFLLCLAGGVLGSRGSRIDCAGIGSNIRAIKQALNLKPMLFLYLSETLWSIPPHPACAMFVTNHGSKEVENNDNDPSSKNDGSRGCVPSSSTYAGKWYSILTLGTNYHVEHHDFPNIPLHLLGKIRQIAPEFYRTDSNDNVWKVMGKAFAEPEFYACMDVGKMAQLEM